MTNVLEEILKDKKEWSVTEQENLTIYKALEAYKQFNATFDDFIGKLTDCYPLEQQDKQAQHVFDAWYNLDGIIEKKLVLLVALHVSGRGNMI